MLSFLLLPLYTGFMTQKEYGIYASLFAYLILGNVVLSYGMETAFFRFVNKHPNQKQTIQATALTSLLISSSIFVIVGLIFKNDIAYWLEYNPVYITYAILILFFDALVVLPFAWFRANEKPKNYTLIKIGNVSINLGLNLFFFLLLPELVSDSTNSVLAHIYWPENKVKYVFLANLAASIITFVWVFPVYKKIGLGFNKYMWKQMIKYAYPVLIAGIAFSINEAFDKILLKYLLPENIAEAQVGIYAACYKLGVFMTLFVTAFRLGIEPYFFSHANSESPQKHYAIILEYFVMFGAVILLAVVVFADVLKLIFIQNKAFWEAMWIVPVILLANLCLGIYHNLSVWYKITDKTRFGAYISVTGALITLVINLAFIPTIGYKASALATLAAYGTMMLLSFYFGKKHYPIPYNLKKIGISLGTAIAFSAIVFYGFNGNLIIGTLLLLIFLGIIYKLEKNRLKLLISRNEN